MENKNQNCDLQYRRNFDNVPCKPVKKPPKQQISGPWVIRPCDKAVRGRNCANRAVTHYREYSNEHKSLRTKVREVITLIKEERYCVETILNSMGSRSPNAMFEGLQEEWAPQVKESEREEKENCVNI